LDEFFRFLVENNLVNVAFIIGAVVFVIAIIGKIKTLIEPSTPMRVFLGIFGLFLMISSVLGYAWNRNAEPYPTPIPPISDEQPTNGEEPANDEQPADGQDFGGSGSTVTDVSTQEENDNTSNPVPQPNALEDGEPLREHYQVVVGDGIFAQGAFSDGQAPYSEQWLWDNDRFNIQRIRREEYPTGCDVARYNTNLLWISGTTGMSFSVNGENVGTYNISDDAHGYIFEWPIRMGDTLCAVGFTPVGFQIVLGPDIYYHYDSYCYRGAC